MSREVNAVNLQKGLTVMAVLLAVSRHRPRTKRSIEVSKRVPDVMQKSLAETGTSVDVPAAEAVELRAAKAKAAANGLRMED